jgi:hypothetical protein
MQRKMFLIFLASGLICICASLALAGDIGYAFRPSSFNLEAKGLPKSGKVFADATIGKPLGLAATIAGTGIYIVTLPMTLPSGAAGEAGWEMVGRPAGWTFVRPVGSGSRRYDEKHLNEP